MREVHYWLISMVSDEGTHYSLFVAKDVNVWPTPLEIMDVCGRKAYMHNMNPEQLGPASVSYAGSTNGNHWADALWIGKGKI